MILVGRLLAVVARDEHDEVGHQVREGMDAIRHQACDRAMTPTDTWVDASSTLTAMLSHVALASAPEVASRGSLIQVVVVEGGCRRIHAALYRQYRP